MASPEVRAKVCEIARTTRYDGADSPKLQGLRSELRAAKVAEFIEKTVNEAPPLTQQQRDRLALLLRGGEPHE